MVFLEILQNSPKNTCARVSFLMKLQATLLQVFFCEFCEISKNAFFYRAPLVDASVNFNPLSANPAKWPNTLKQFVGKLATNCLGVFDHFVNLALKGLILDLEE